MDYEMVEEDLDEFRDADLYKLSEPVIYHDPYLKKTVEFMYFALAEPKGNSDMDQPVAVFPLNKDGEFRYKDADYTVVGWKEHDDWLDYLEAMEDVDIDKYVDGEIEDIG